MSHENSQNDVGLKARRASWAGFAPWQSDSRRIGGSPVAKRVSALAVVMACLPVLAHPQSAQPEDPLTESEHRLLGIQASVAVPGYANLCDPQMRFRNVNVPRDGTARANRQAHQNGQTNGTPRPTRAAPPPVAPTQVFDNLYFLGSQSVTAWLYGTEDGYLLIDGLNTDEEAQEMILGGMATLGLDPSAITAVVVTHGHGDHYGGADYIAETLGIEVLMTAEDWELVDYIGTHPRFGPPPTQGGTIVDGEVLQFGTSRLTILKTPGHTPGTVSPMFEVLDNGAPHMAILWGGTGFNFGPNAGMFQTYSDSVRTAQAVSQQAGVDVFLSGHPSRDGTIEKLEQLAQREAGADHPFVTGADGYALFTLLEHCALAQKARVLALDD